MNWEDRLKKARAQREAILSARKSVGDPQPAVPKIPPPSNILDINENPNFQVVETSVEELNETPREDRPRRKRAIIIGLAFCFGLGLGIGGTLWQAGLVGAPGDEATQSAGSQQVAASNVATLPTTPQFGGDLPIEPSFETALIGRATRRALPDGIVSPENGLPTTGAPVVPTPLHSAPLIAEVPQGLPVQSPFALTRVLALSRLPSPAAPLLLSEPVSVSNGFNTQATAVIARPSPGNRPVIAETTALLRPAVLSQASAFSGLVEQGPGPTGLEAGFPGAFAAYSPNQLNGSVCGADNNDCSLPNAPRGGIIFESTLDLIPTRPVFVAISAQPIAPVISEQGADTFGPFGDIEVAKRATELGLYQASLRQDLPAIDPVPPKPFIPGADLLSIWVFAPGAVADDKIAAVGSTLNKFDLAVERVSRVGFRISQDQVRFYDLASAEAAAKLAQKIGATARDFTSARGGPPVGRVEIYLAGESGVNPRPRPAARAPVRRPQISDAERRRQNVLSKLRGG
ncbi:MAG: hypothetical protein AAGO57_07290 [Pseudomonadota bacterium]